VLVIIGLIVGGVLVGQNLIAAAGVRATISQIEKYNAAINTFYGKYNNLPGDMTAANAAAFGFTTRTGDAGRGDGNGQIAGWWGGPFPTCQGGEDTLFWVDLSQAGLIEGGFTGGVSYTYQNVADQLILTAPPTWDVFYPQAKLGNGNYVVVFTAQLGGDIVSATNYYEITRLTDAAGTTVNGYPTAGTGLTPAQAYSIDLTIDDGSPHAGRVTSTGPGTIGGTPGLGRSSDWAGATITPCEVITTTPRPRTLRSGPKLFLLAAPLLQDQGR
jgi:hypothetical protein